MGRRILHLADLHLGYRPSDAGPIPPEHFARRDELLRRIVDWILDEARDRVGAVLIVGDLFDSPYPPDTLVEGVLTDLGRLVAAGVAVVTVPGNHDELSYPEGVYRREAARWPGTLVTQPQPGLVTQLELDGGKVALYAAAYVQGRTPPTIRPEPVETATPAVAAFHATLVDQLGEFIAEGERALRLRLEDAAAAGFRYVALGHIHRPRKRWQEGRTVAAYAGMVEGKGFHDPGGAPLLLVDPLAEPVRVESVPFPTTRILTGELRLDAIPDAEALERRIAELTEGVQMARVRLQGHATFAVDLERIRASLGGRIEVLELEGPGEGWDPGDWTRWREEPTLRGAFVRKVLERMEKTSDPQERQLLEEAAVLGLAALREAGG
jgi:DNA repair exonuclease SbcCD nuclease subunit